MTSDKTEIPTRTEVGAPLISIVLPSFRDERIVDAIESIRLFDDCDAVQLILVDGDSGEEFVNLVKPLMRERDIFISEPDKGIFDALNKGLDLVEAPYIGWLGSDDLYSDRLKASEVIEALSTNDIYVGSLYLCSGFEIKRKTASWMARMGLVQVGLHNPHYATFGRASLFKKHKFQLGALASDIGYFLDVFSEQPRVACSPEIFVLQEMGGFSIASKRKVLKVNRNAFSYYRKHGNPIKASLAICLKLGYKLAGAAKYRLRPRTWEDEFPETAEILHRRFSRPSS